MLGRRSFVLGLALIGLLLAGRFLAPFAYRVAILDPQLREALERSDTRRIEALIRRGADVNQRVDSLVDTPLELAIQQHDSRFVEYLLKRGAQPDLGGGKEVLTALMAAAKWNATDCMPLFIAADEDINSPRSRGDFALMIAAEKDSAEGVRLLLAAGANPRTIDSEGMTALIHACRFGRITHNGVLQQRSGKVVQMLLDAGADPKVSFWGGTALSNAEEANQAHQVAALRRVNAPGLREELSGTSQSEMFYAVRTRDLGMVKRLLRAGAGVAALDGYDRTPLAWAATQEDGRILHYLLHHASDVKKALEMGRNSTALGHSMAYQYSMKLLLDAGADPNARFHGRPLIECVNADERRLLLAAGAKQPR